MKVLVTGADGLLGSNLVRELLQRQTRVKAFVLPNSPSKTLANLDIERFEGNLLNAEDLIKAIHDCDAVIHAAANTNIWPDRSEMVRRVNIDGTRNLVEAAIQAKVKRMVYVGTANTFGFGSKESPGDETRPYRSARYGLDYMDSKRAAQQLILKAVQERELPALVVNPTFMLGPYDSKPSAGAMVVAIHQGKVPGYTSGGRNYIYVKDVAIAICNALSMGRIGECYIAGHQNLNYKEAFGKIAQIVGAKAPAIPIPSFASLLYGAIGSFGSKLTGKPPTVSLAMARISTDEHYFSARKAIDELQLPQTPIEQAIRESFEWMRANGVC
ncbi:MAG: NAD-dependent epimerase/dehydratase family protein [Bacteroidota bacterium]